MDTDERRAAKRRKVREKFLTEGNGGNEEGVDSAVTNELSRKGMHLPS
jgi:hypothetical protein